MKLVKGSRKQLLALFLIGVATALVGLATHRTASKLSAMRAKTEALAEDEVLLEKLADFRQESAAGVDQVDQIETALPQTHQEIARFTSQLEAAAAAAGGQTSLGIAPKPEAMAIEAQAVNGLRIRLDFTGSYQGLIQFLDTLANLPYFTQIESIGIGASPVGGVRADINLILYLASEQK